MAMRGKKLKHFLLFWLLLVLGNLLKNASCLASCLTLLKESNHLAQRKFVHSSLAPWVLSSFDRGSHPQGSCNAVLGAAWTHALAWERASWLCKASKSAGCLHLGNRGQPQVNPWCTCRSLPSYNLPHLGIALQWHWSTWSGLPPESTDLRG